jgi:hypothetical protein
MAPPTGVVVTRIQDADRQQSSFSISTHVASIFTPIE